MDDSLDVPVANLIGEESLLEELRLLAQDARNMAEAEMAYQSSRAAFLAEGLRGIAILAGVAVVFAIFSLLGLTVGLLIALTPLVSAWGATGIVAGGLALLAVIALVRAKGRWKYVSAVLAGKDGTK
jgi:hypothetical protein